MQIVQDEQRQGWRADGMLRESRLETALTSWASRPGPVPQRFAAGPPGAARGICAGALQGWQRRQGQPLAEPHRR